MPQLNVYMDRDTLKKIEQAARIDRSSVSGWVRKKLTHALKEGWPDGYFDLFGALADVDFERPEQPKLEDDVPRQSL